MSKVDDKAGEEYWSKEWAHLKIPDHKLFSDRSAANYRMWKYHELFSKAFSGLPEGKKSILEIGCGNSAFLPYFKEEWGFDIAGIDYSREGCDSQFLYWKRQA